MKRVPTCLRVHRALTTDLEFVHVLLFSVKCIEDCTMKDFQYLVSTNLNGPGDHFVLLHKTLRQLSTDDEHIESIEFFIVNRSLNCPILRLFLHHNLLPPSSR